MKLKSISDYRTPAVAPSESFLTLARMLTMSMAAEKLGYRLPSR